MNIIYDKMCIEFTIYERKYVLTNMLKYYSLSIKKYISLVIT